MKRCHALVLVLIALLAVPAVAYAALPSKYTWFDGKTVGDRHYPAGYGSGPGIHLKSASRRTLSRVVAPQVCGFTSRAFVKDVAISRSGAFSKTRVYTERHDRARSGSGGDYDLVMNWTVKVSGKFSTATKASGKLSIVLKHHLEDQSGANPPGPIGDEVTCSVGPLSWTAKKRVAETNR